MSASGRAEDGPGARWLENLARLDGVATDAGITAADGGPAEDHQPDGTPMGELMLKHEMGVGVPARPVLEPALEEARAELERAAAPAVAEAATSGSPEAASAALGPILRDAMLRQIDAGLDPPLRGDGDGVDGPDERGPGDKPLVATGQLRSAIRWAHRGRVP